MNKVPERMNELGISGPMIDWVKEAKKQMCVVCVYLCVCVYL